MSSNSKSASSNSNSGSTPAIFSIDGSHLLQQHVAKIAELSPTAPNAANTAKQVVEDVLSHPSIYVFAELSQLPAVKALEQSSPDTHKALQLFTFGTLKDNKLKLSEVQTKKLKKLTVINLASEKKILSYGELSKELGLVDNQIRELEDLLIECLYEGIIVGKLNQKEKTLFVDFSISRDLKPDQIDSMINILEQWCGKSQQLLDNINQQIVKAKSTREANSKHKLDHLSQIEAHKINLKNQAENMMGMGGQAEMMMMHMLDDEMDKQKNRKRGKGSHGA